MEYNFDLVRKLVGIAEKQPDTREGKFNHFIAIRRLAEITGKGLKESSQDLREARENLQQAQEQLERADIKNKDLVDYVDHTKKYIKSLQTVEDKLKQMRATIGSNLEDILQDFEKLQVTDHDFSQLVGCPVDNVKKARETYEERENSNFYRHALHIEAVEEEKPVLFDLLTDVVLWVLDHNQEAKKKADKFINRLILENDIPAYKVNEEGELVEWRPGPQVVVDNSKEGTEWKL